MEERIALANEKLQREEKRAKEKHERALELERMRLESEERRQQSQNNFMLQLVKMMKSQPEENLGK